MVDLGFVGFQSEKDYEGDTVVDVVEWISIHDGYCVLATISLML